MSEVCSYLAKVLKSMHYAAMGIAYTWQHERNFRLQVVIGTVAMSLAFWLQVHVPLVAALCALVLGLELVNTAIEALVDLTMPEIHPLAKRAKDTAAGAVFLAAVFSFFIGVWIFAPPLLQQLRLLL